MFIGDTGIRSVCMYPLDPVWYLYAHHGAQNNMKSGKRKTFSLLSSNTKKVASSMQNQKFRAVILIFVLSTAAVNFTSVFSLLNNETSIQASGKIAYILPLHVEGRYIKNNLGQTIYLRGVHGGSGAGDFANDCTGMWTPAGGRTGYDGVGIWNETAVRTHLQAMRDWGFNVLAVFINIDWWIHNKSTTLYRELNNVSISTSHPYRYCIKETLRIAQEYGIYVLLRTRYISVWDSWTGQPIYPSTSYFGNNLESSKQGFTNFWVNFATELKDYPNVIFHLWDEPDTSRGNTREDWIDTANRTLIALRNAGIEQIIMVHWAGCGSCLWMEDFYNAGLVMDNVVFTQHIYRYHGTFEGNPNSPTDIDYIRHQLGDDGPMYGGPRSYLRIIQNLSLPVWIGAIGASRGWEDDNEFTYFNNTLNVLNEWNLGYIAYQYGRQDMRWTIQESAPAVAQLNRVGQALVDAIAAGNT